MRSQILDWSVVLVYMIAILAVGFWARRRVKDAGGFLLGNRRLGSGLMIASTFAGGVNANQPVSVAANTYINGLSGMWLTLAFIVATPFYWMWPPVLRRLRIVTPVDFYRMRFGRQMEWCKLGILLASAPFIFGVGIKAAAIIVVAVAGPGAAGAPAIGLNTAIAIIVLPTLVYTLMGGIVAAFAVDMLQSLLIIVLSFLLLPFMIWKVGGAEEAVARVHAANPQAWDLVGVGAGIPLVWLFWFALSALCAAPDVYGTSSGAARDEMASRWAVIGSLGKRICTVGWAVTGVLAIALLGAPAVSGVNPEDVFARCCLDVLPAGLRGVMVAAMLAAVMSSLAGLMLGFGASLVNNLYKNYLKSTASSSHYLVSARLFTALPLVAGWYIAASGIGLVHLVIISEQSSGLLGLTMLAGLVWRRATGRGAIAALGVMAPLFFFGNRPPAAWPDWYRLGVDLLLEVYRWIGINPHVDASTVLSAKPENLLQVTTPLWIGAGVLVLVVVSLLTRQHDERLVAEFYARAETPLGDEHKLRAAGFQADTLEDMNRQQVEAAPQSTAQSARLLLLDFLNWPWLVITGKARLRDYWVDFAGVLGSILFIGAFLGLLHWSVQMF